MNKQDFNSIEELVFNHSFRDWILNRNEADAQFWEAWTHEHSEKAGMINYAKAIVYALSADHYHLSDVEISKEVNKILDKIDPLHHRDSRQKTGDTHVSGKLPQFPIRRLWTAAATLALIGTLVLFYFFGMERKERPATYLSDEQTAKVFAGMIELINNSDSLQTIRLFDSSRIVLSGKSKLTYSQDSSAARREIYLTGEAFFDVAKNPAKPFFVYTKNMVTKVLGTSFRVKAYGDERKASVIVESGKVSVTGNRTQGKGAAVSDKFNVFLLTRNQKIEYDFDQNRVSKTIADSPKADSGELAKNFIFRETPIREVFKTLERIYEIKINYDEESVKSYSLSATLTDGSYFDKLNIICKAIDATYEIIDGNIFITLNRNR